MLLTHSSVVDMFTEGEVGNDFVKKVCNIFKWANIFHFNDFDIFTTFGYIYGKYFCVIYLVLSFWYILLSYEQRCHYDPRMSLTFDSKSTWQAVIIEKIGNLGGNVGEYGGFAPCISRYIYFPSMMSTLLALRTLSVVCGFALCKWQRLNLFCCLFQKHCLNSKVRL